MQELYDSEKADELKAEIEEADVPQEVAAFLTVAAERHTKFDFENIAEFYAHASADVQRLMERSALVVIDFDQAIEEGYVQVSEELLAQAAATKDENE